MNSLQTMELSFDEAVELDCFDEKHKAYERLVLARRVAAETRDETLREVIDALRTQLSQIYVDGCGICKAKRAELLQAIETIERLF